MAWAFCSGMAAEAALFFTAGVLAGRAELVAPAWNWRKNLGSMIAPETAALLSRSLRTLVVRVERQNRTAQAVAEAMAQHARVLYPGLPEFPGHALAKAQMQGCGGMPTIEVEGGGEAATGVADRLKLFALAPSLGGAESLVTQPCTTRTTAFRRRSAPAAASPTPCCGCRSAWKMPRT